MKKNFILLVALGTLFLTSCKDIPKEQPKQVQETVQPPEEKPTQVEEQNTAETAEATQTEQAEEEGETTETFVNYDKQNFNGNPFDKQSGITKSIEPLIFKYLAVKADNGQYTLQALESYDLKDNILTLKIKPELLWCNKTPLDAYDVETTMKCLFGFSDLWDTIESVAVVDDLTMEIKLIKQDETFVDKLFSYPISVQDDDVYVNYGMEFSKLIENNRKLDGDKYVLDESMKSKFDEIVNETLSYKPDPVDMFMSGKYIILSWDENEIVFRQSKGQNEKLKYYKVIGKWTENTADLEKALLDLNTILS